MISSPDRQTAVTLIDAAIIAGARQLMACRTLKLSPRTYRRWTKGLGTDAGGVRIDQRPFADRPEPRNKLTQEECQAVLEQIAFKLNRNSPQEWANSDALWVS